MTDQTATNDNDTQDDNEMTATETILEARIKDIIRQDGPMSVASYMAHCLFDAEHGYYTTRVPFGAEGDFVTAPEVSQMFGELIGIWCAATWQAMGSPEDFALVEMGPGRGTLMADILRAASTVPGFNQGAEVCMVETSPRLKNLQQDTLEAYVSAGFNISWRADVLDLPKKPTLFVANELLDALVFHQYEKTDTAWQERCVGLNDDGALCMMFGPGTLNIDLLPGGHEQLDVGSIFEKSPARETLSEAIATHIVKHGGSGLFIDYGNSAPGTGDTFQAIERHEFVSPLTRCGMADLTSHVDFSALFAKMKSVKGATVTPPMEQGEFLVRMGLVERARQLGQDKSAQEQAKIRLDIERLAGEGTGERTGAGGMGTLFKVLMVAQTGLLPPPFQDPDARTTDNPVQKPAH